MADAERVWEVWQEQVAKAEAEQKAEIEELAQPVGSADRAYEQGSALIALADSMLDVITQANRLEELIKDANRIFNIGLSELPLADFAKARDRARQELGAIYKRAEQLKATGHKSGALTTTEAVGWADALVHALDVQRPHSELSARYRRWRRLNGVWD